jgi:opacity protein-like surface antigen
MKDLSRVWCLAKRITALLAIVMFLSFSGFGQQQQPWTRLEFNISGGYGLAQFKGDSMYSDEWSYRYLDYVTEDTTLSMKADNAIFFGGGFSYFFTPVLGVQLGGGFFSSNVGINGNFDFSHKWTTSSTVYDHNLTWEGDGKLRTIPLYLNIVGKFRMNLLDLYVSAGPTIYFNSFEANSYVGFGDTIYFLIWPYYYQYVDAFQIPVEIPKTSWTSFGGNIGAGFDFKVSPQIAIVVEGRYFIVPQKSLNWEWIPGTYTSVIYEQFEDWDYSADDLAPYEETMTTADVKPSFFCFSVGIRIGLSK